ncbi:MAG: septum formation protein Maf [Bacteroidetes bacterium]|nr:septum formation protein Maf [Bacteroidota bacterium]
MTKTKIILGSKSPRRLDILEDAGFEVEVVKPNVVEQFPYNLNFHKVPEYISKLKIWDVYSYLGNDDDFIICADTVVIFNGKLLGKPRTLEQAFKYLKALNGKSHEVVTGVSMRKKKKQISFSEQAIVHFKELTTEEIIKYIEVGNPMDKAGAYNIEEYFGVEKIEGEYQNVMGLPIKRILQEIKNW